jgi:hypothetical protein
VFSHFFCRPLTLGECYTGQPACSIRPANHALAYICLYPCPLPFGRRRCVLLCSNLIIDYFASELQFIQHIIAYCLSHPSSFSVHLNCVCRNHPWYRLYRKKTDSFLNVPWTPKSQHRQLQNRLIRLLKTIPVWFWSEIFFSSKETSVHSARVFF